MRSGPQRAGPGADREQLRAAPRAGVAPWARGHRGPVVPKEAFRVSTASPVPGDASVLR